ncbi:MAG: hypothetical protein CVU54_08610 [Deltaproteobacteria bacterium HGW-Deltaproteobacteria-12]|nr:MAG: hypothetical protein CVU54_08610 [Deltaproteobacteria bacterium HGW-Deltaproteobacteria-12]
MNRTCEINKNKSIFMKLPITLVLSVIFWGCTSYQSIVKNDSTTPKTDLVKLTVVTDTDFSVKLCEIDGISGDHNYGNTSNFPCRDNMYFSSQLGDSVEITMEPGPHTLTIGCVTRSFIGGNKVRITYYRAHDITFVAKKGLVYELVPIHGGNYFTGNFCSAKVVEKTE